MTHRKNTQAALTQSINSWQMAALSLPYMGAAFFFGSMNVVQGIYAKYFGLSLTTLAAVLLLSRLFDAVSDPLIGFFSDRYRTRTGTRKPFVLVGGLFLIVCSYFLFVPPDNVSVAYFTFWMLAFYMAFTIFSLSIRAWASEVTSSSEERAKIFSIKAFLSNAGGLLFFLVPFLPLFTTTEITPETLKVSIILGAIVILPALYCALRYVPNGPPSAPSHKAANKIKSSAIKDILGAFKGNKPFQMLALAYSFTALGLGMHFGLFFIFVDGYLGQGELYAQIAVVGIGLGFLLIPLTYKLIVLLGKKKVWLISMGLLMFSVLYASQLVPEESAFIPLLIMKCFIVFYSMSTVIIVASMLSETIDYGRINDRNERTGTYYAVYSFLYKAEAAIGISLGLAIAGLLGFDATATSHSEQAVFAIHMTVSWIPFVIFFIGSYLIYLIPLDERRSAIVARRLAGRALRESAQSKQDSPRESLQAS